jgi:deoxyribonuclease V
MGSQRSDDSLGSALSHRWNVTPREAKAIQETLRGTVVTADGLGKVSRVAGVDASYNAVTKRTRAAIAVLSYPELELVDSSVIEAPTTFPYVPGLLSFREIPAVLKALRRLKRPPDLLLCDGQGYAHPRRFGFASHLGVVAGLPSIGVAKTRLIGAHDPVPEKRGCWRPLDDHGEVIGAVLRTRAGAKPLFVSIGHRVSLETAIRFVLVCAPRYRLPETTRWAHRLASAESMRHARA